MLPRPTWREEWLLRDPCPGAISPFAVTALMKPPDQKQQMRDQIAPLPIPRCTVRGQVLSGLVGQASVRARASSASSQVHKFTLWALRSQAGPRVGKGWMGTEAPGSQLSLLPFKERPPRYRAQCPTLRNKCDLSSDLQLIRLPSDPPPNPGP